MKPNSAFLLVSDNLDKEDDSLDSVFNIDLDSELLQFL